MKSFQKGPPQGKAKLKRWWTYLSQFSLTVHHIPGIKNELSDYISRNNFDALIGESSEQLAKEAFQRMDVQLDLSMRTAGVLEGWSLTDYQSEYQEIVQTLSTGLEPRVIDGHQWYKSNQYLFYKRGTGGPPTQNRQHKASNSGPRGKGTPKRKKKKKKGEPPAQPERKGMEGQGPQSPKKKKKTKRKKQKRKNTPRQPSQERLGTAETRTQHSRPHRTPEPETAGGKRGAQETTRVPKAGQNRSPTTNTTNSRH